MEITTTKLTRAAGLAAVAAGTLFIAVQVKHPEITVDFVQSTQWKVRQGMKIAMATLALAGVTGMYLRQVRQIGLLGLVGLSANPVLSALAVRSAGVAPTLGVALSVSAYNLGTAVGSGTAGATLGTGLGAVGPVVVGTAVAALTLVPTSALALAGRRRSPGPALSPARAPG